MSSRETAPKIDADSQISVRNQLLTILADDIKNGRYKPGQRFPSERALAEKFAISRTSVRETVAQMIAQRALVRVNGRGTFVADRASATTDLAADQGRQLGFLISERVFHFAQPGYNQILSGFTEICHATGCRLRFHPVKDAGDPDLQDASRTGQLDGSIIVGGLSLDVIEKLKQFRHPLILVDLLNSTDDVSVSVDYTSGTRSAMNHLFELGHQTIGFIGFPNSAKYIAYWQSLQSRGLPYRPEHVEFLDSSDLLPGMLAGYRAMQKLLSRSSRPTAFLVTNDHAALGAIEALLIANLEVPKDVSIIGYDDLGRAATSLTTVRTDLIEVGRIAGRTLLSWIQTGQPPERETSVPVELVIRGSTASPATDQKPDLVLESRG
jgi:DNA-binding LacI/PurR family transcriptional regulator